MRHVLGLDPGGSKCDALLLQEDGTVLHRARATEPGLSGRSPTVVLQATRAVLRDNRPDRLTIATVGNHREVSKEFAALHIPLEQVIGLDEGAGPLALIGSPHGVVALSGTGSRLLGQTADGRYLTLDGLGPILGDRGSGYHIGHLALRAAVKAVQHPRHATSLKTKVFDACGANPPSAKTDQPPSTIMARWMAQNAARARLDPDAGRLGELIRFSLKPHDRSVIASLATLVDAEARAGDAVATAILQQAAAELAETFADLVDHLGLAAAEFPVVGTGSVALKSEIYWGAFCDRALATAPRCRLVRSPLPPVAGVALAGLEQLPGIDPAAVRHRLLASFKETTLS